MSSPEKSPSVGSSTVRATAIAVGLTLLYVAAFLIPGHNPQPNGLKLVAVHAPTSLVTELRAAHFDVTAVADRPAAERAIRNRVAYGGFVPGTTGRPELLIASGSSAVVASTLTGIATAAHIPVAADVAPLAKGDPRGNVFNLLILPLIVTAIIGALTAAQLLPSLRIARRVALTALVSALSGFGATAIAHAVGALPGSYLAESGLVALLVLAVALPSGALVRWLGPTALTVAFTFFLVLGVPAAGLASAPELLPTPWKQIGGLLPPGALSNALRGTAYFGGTRIAGSVLVLLGWAAIGAVMHLLLDRRTHAGGPATSTDAGADPDAATPVQEQAAASQPGRGPLAATASDPVRIRTLSELTAHANAPTLIHATTGPRHAAVAAQSASLPGVRDPS